MGDTGVVSSDVGTFPCSQQLSRFACLSNTDSTWIVILAPFAGFSRDQLDNKFWRNVPYRPSARDVVLQSGAQVLWARDFPTILIQQFL